MFPFPNEFCQDLFAVSYDSDKTRRQVCETLALPCCQDVYEANGSPTIDECIQMLTDLPLLDNGYSFDGNSQACCTVHSVMTLYLTTIITIIAP